MEIVVTLRFPLVLALCCGLIACSTGPGPGADGVVGGDVHDGVVLDGVDDIVYPSCGPDPAPDFNGHTVPRFKSAEAFMSFADTGTGPMQGKFVLTDYSGIGGPTYFMDPSFYSLHDEWYWFRLLNGAAIPCLDLQPEELSFDTIDAVYDAYSHLEGAPQGSLPLDLHFTGDGRIYSPNFYDLGLFDEPRFFGLGAILHYPADPDRVIPEALWLFELEYGDKASQKQVLRFHERLKRALPPAVAAELGWLARSNFQELRGALINEGDSVLKGKVVTYADLVVAGNVESYNDGITAGRLLMVHKGELGAASVGLDEIVVLEEVPDYLPPVAAIVTAVPQTPLAHLNLLAKSRGTPNVHIAGVMDDPALETWDYYNKPVALKVADGTVVWEELTDAEYQTYLDKLEGPAMAIPQIDLSDAPWTVDLTQGGLADLAGRVPLTGGKAAAMAAFNDFPELRTPDTPLAITIRAYADHMAPMQAILGTLLADDTFAHDAPVRFVVLEGEEDFREEHAGDSDALAWLDGFLVEHHGETFLGSLVGSGGLKRLIRDPSLHPDLDAALNAALGAQFVALAPTQGLRFRSSSTAEDIQGFNGAGLYDSNTGYLDPSLQTDPKLKDRDVAWALKKTWASYWGFEAFEERRVAGIDHLSGHMGVLVHPRFDDALEDCNGVITLYLAREVGGDRLEMVVNAQAGSISVTNPDPLNPTTPEIASVSAVGDGDPVVDHLQGSSEVPLGSRILTDGELSWLFQNLSPLAQAWLDNANIPLLAPHQRSTLVLDFEFKRMHDGWPALATGEITDGGLVLKQVRTLDSPIPALAPSLLNDAVPRDVLEQVLRVIRRTCTAGSLHLETLEYTTDPAKSWALDHAIRPFNSTVDVTLTGPIVDIGLTGGEAFTVDHTDALFTHPEMEADGPWTLHVALDGGSEVLGLTEITLTEGGDWSLKAGPLSADGAGVQCEVQELHEGPAAYLATLFPSD